MKEKSAMIWKCEGLSLTKLHDLTTFLLSPERPTVVFWEPETKRFMQQKSDVIKLVDIQVESTTGLFTVTIQIKRSVRTLAIREAYVIKEPKNRQSQSASRTSLAPVPDHQHMPMKHLEVNQEAGQVLDMNKLIEALTIELPLAERHLTDLRKLLGKKVVDISQG